MKLLKKFKTVFYIFVDGDILLNAGILRFNNKMKNYHIF